MAGGEAATSTDDEPRPATHRTDDLVPAGTIDYAGGRPHLDDEERAQAATGGLLTLPRLFRLVHRRPYHQVSGLQPSVAVQAEPPQFKRLAVNLAVSLS